MTRKRLKFILQELFRPSDRRIVRPLRRIIRRSVIVIIAFGAVLAAGAWVASYTGLPVQCANSDVPLLVTPFGPGFMIRLPRRVR